jgi:hypothetical protein
MRIAAYILFAGGVMLAISGAAKLPDMEPSAARSLADRFPDSWPVFATGFALTVAGLVIWWRDEFALRAAHHADDRDGSNPLTLLRGLVPQLHELSNDFAELDATQVTNRVEHLLEHTVLPFTEGRHKIMSWLGMSAGADLLVTAAFGERMLNRVWSAAADGHLEEARSSLAEAVGAFEQAQRQLPTDRVTE